MMRVAVFVFLAVVFPEFGESNQESNADTLLLTQVVFRHGDRSATRTYPNDPEGEGIWPQGFGQLTQTGMRQHYSLGQFFRQRYIVEKQLLYPNYTKNQIYIESTDYERTLMSAESNLAGLYPPEGDQKWEEGVGQLWQPIPVHTRPVEEDQVLHLTRGDCPRLNQLNKQLADSQPYSTIEAQNKELIDSLAEKSGLNAAVPSLAGLYDIFFCEKQNNLTRYWPDWMDTATFQKLKEFQDASMRVSHSVPDIVRLLGGPLVARLVENMKTRLEGEEDLRRMYMFSAHDTTVAALLSALRVFDPAVNPPYISCVMVELYQGADNSPYVQVFFRNDSTGEIPPYQLLIPGCTSMNCKFSAFVEATQGMSLPVESLNAECAAKFSPSASSVAITVAAFILMVILLLGISYCYLRRKRKKSYRSYRLTKQDGEDDDEEEMVE